MDLGKSRSAISEPAGNRWLVENGPNELERLLRAIVYHPSSPILIVDDEGRSRDASIGASKLLGLPREEIIGRPVVDFADPRFKPEISELWKALQEQGEHEGTLRLVDLDANAHDVEYTARGSVLPVRNVIVLRDKSGSEGWQTSGSAIPAWVQDYALYLLDLNGKIAAWYSGAIRIYRYECDEAMNQHVSFLYPGDDTLEARLEGELKRTSVEGHMGAEGWQARKDGSRFWANTITTALRDGDGCLHGFARVVRDFTDRHEKDEKLARSRARSRPIPAHSTIAGVVSGEFDRIPEANDTFLDLVGYSREDLASGRLSWPDLTPAEYGPLDDLAHEEGLRFGGVHAI